MQRLQRQGERDRAAVRVREDAVVLEGALAVHLGDDERDPGLETVRRRLVDRDRAAADGRRDELARRARADREEEHVDTGTGQRIRRRLLDRPLAELPSCRARRREDAHVLVAARAQEIQRDRSDGAGRTDDADRGPLSH